ncbi:MAG TPA: type 1 glutamine amidotransferase domain-containing protein [Acidimicrobiales bacterium]|jgi:protease I|nr:type 1 glutamine amidotransferase domain-containing protein [Acidimicrobiales bacterium]
MTEELKDRRVAFMIANEGVEQVELTTPWQAVIDAGARAELLSPEEGSAQAFNHLDKGDVFPVDLRVGDADPASYDALVLPGGVANPDQLRMVPEAVRFVQALFEAGKPAAVICHGPWTVVEADLVRGRTLTSWPSLKTDIRNAGGTWVDREVQVCTEGPNVLVTSRKPADLPAFCTELVGAFSHAGQPA